MFSKKSSSLVAVFHFLKKWHTGLCGYVARFKMNLQVIPAFPQMKKQVAFLPDSVYPECLPSFPESFCEISCFCVWNYLNAGTVSGGWKGLMVLSESLVLLILVYILTKSLVYLFLNCSSSQGYILYYDAVHTKKPLPKK